MEVFFNDDALRKNVQRECLSLIPDLQKLSRKFLKHKADLQDCVRLYNFVIKLPKILHTFQPDLFLRKTYCGKLIQLVEDFTPYEELVKTTIDFESVDDNEIRIRSSFSEELAELSKALKHTSEKMNEELNSFKSKVKTKKNVSLENNAKYGHCFRVTRSVWNFFHFSCPSITQFQTISNIVGRGSEEDSEGKRRDHTCLEQERVVF